MHAAQRAAVPPPAHEGARSVPKFALESARAMGGEYNPRCIAQYHRPPVGMCAARTLGQPEVRA